MNFLGWPFGDDDSESGLLICSFCGSGSAGGPLFLNPGELDATLEISLSGSLGLFCPCSFGFGDRGFLFSLGGFGPKGFLRGGRDGGGPLSRGLPFLMFGLAGGGQLGGLSSSSSSPLPLGTAMTGRGLGLGERVDRTLLVERDG